MSIEVLTWVFKHSEARLADRLVLLALADYAHDDGDKAFPRVKKLAMKARVSERTVERCLESLAAAGAIEQTGITPKGGVKVWRVVMEQPDNLSARQAGQRNPTSRQQQPDNLSALNREPSVEPSVEPSAGAGGADAPTPETHPLSHLLSNLLGANGVPEGKRRVRKAWADAERLMRDRDGRDPAQAEMLLRWALDHEFWRGVILSMPKFRERYDQIRLQRERDGSGPLRTEAATAEFYDG